MDQRKHPDGKELEALFADDPEAGAFRAPHWQELVKEVRDAMRDGLPSGSDQARTLAWRWVRLLTQRTHNRPELASLLMRMQIGGPQAPQTSAATQAMLEWLDQAFMQARFTLFARYLTPEQADELQRRQLVDSNRRAWPALVLELRSQMEAGVDARATPVQAIVVRWQQLFRDSFCGNDAVLESRLREALMREPDLQLGVGFDDALMAYLHRAHMVASDVTPPGAGPKPSALLVATQRAAHQLLDQPLVLDDPMALTLLGPQETQALRDHPDRFRQPASLGLRSSVVVRSRLADDIWLEAVGRGTDQYVILGAGLDTSAYRQAGVRGRIFEVDLPATQQWKRERLQEAGISAPPALRFVPVDFERVGLAEGLKMAGFNPDEPALFSWLGVTMYLDEGAVEETLRVIAACAPGSAVLLEYAMPLHTLPPMMRMAMEQLTAQFAERGEPWKSFYEPTALVGKLTALGFSRIYTWTTDELNERYLANRQDGLRIGAAPTRLVLATV